jgi:hypothetical protein
MRQFQIRHFPTLFFEQYSCQNFHMPSSEGHDLQKLTGSVVISTPSESFVCKPFENQYKNFDFDTLLTLIQTI